MRSNHSIFIDLSCKVMAKHTTENKKKTIKHSIHFGYFMYSISRYIYIYIFKRAHKKASTDSLNSIEIMNFDHKIFPSQWMLGKLEIQDEILALIRWHKTLPQTVVICVAVCLCVCAWHLTFSNLITQIENQSWLNFRQNRLQCDLRCSIFHFAS